MELSIYGLEDVYKEAFEALREPVIVVVLVEVKSILV